MDRAIWAVNGGILREWMKQQVQFPSLLKIPWSNAVEASQVFDWIYDQQMHHGLHLKGYAAMEVVPINLNRRLAVQQGTFLCSANMDYSLEQNLYGMFDLTPEEIHQPPRGFFINPRSATTINALQRLPIVQIILDRKLRPEALTELGRMNIKHGSLFPGLDGFTRDLKRQAYWHSQEASAKKPEAPHEDANPQPQ